MSPGEIVLEGLLESFASQKALAERAVEQLNDEEIRLTLGADTNSVAVIMKHVAGNLRSRFTDFIDADGEKPWRTRDEEFIDRYAPGPAGRAEIMADWESGWQALFDAVGALGPEQLELNVFIRGQPHTVPLALGRALAHIGYHAGQIVLTAKCIKGDAWRTITVPRGGSAEHNHSLGYQPDPDAPA